MITDRYRNKVTDLIIQNDLQVGIDHPYETGGYTTIMGYITEYNRPLKMHIMDYDTERMVINLIGDKYAIGNRIDSELIFTEVKKRMDKMVHN